MKTMNVGKWFVLLMMACTIIACGNYDPIDPNSSVPDPVGTVSLRMRNGMDEATVLEVKGYFYIYIDAAGNFRNAYASDYQSEFVGLGIMKGLGNVTRIPVSGWASGFAVTPGHGYVARTLDGQRYLRIYVVDAIIGNQFTEFNVKYQYPFLYP